MSAARIFPNRSFQAELAKVLSLRVTNSVIALPRQPSLRPNRPDHSRFFVKQATRIGPGMGGFGCSQRLGVEGLGVELSSSVMPNHPVRRRDELD